MTARTKSALLLGATLAIGIVLGTLISGAIVNRRMAEFARLQRPGGVAMHFEHMIEPSDEAQRRAIREVLEAAGPRIQTIMREAHMELLEVSDSVRAELDPLLTDEQKRRLDRRMRVGPGRRWMEHLRHPGAGQRPVRRPGAKHVAPSPVDSL